MVGIILGIFVFFLSITSYSSKRYGGDFIFPIKSFEGVRTVREALNLTYHYLEQSQEFMFGGNLCQYAYKKRKCRRNIAILRERYDDLVHKYINRKQMCKYVFKNCYNNKRLKLKPTYKCLSCQATVFLSNERRVIKANHYVIKLYCSKKKTFRKQKLCMKKIYGYMREYKHVRSGTVPLWFCMKHGYCTTSVLDHDYSKYDRNLEYGEDTEINNEDAIYGSSSNSTMPDMTSHNTHESEDLNLSGATHQSTHNPHRGRYRHRNRWSHPDELFYHYHGFFNH